MGDGCCLYPDVVQVYPSLCCTDVNLLRYHLVVALHAFTRLQCTTALSIAYGRRLPPGICSVRQHFVPNSVNRFIPGPNIQHTYTIVLHSQE